MPVDHCVAKIKRNFNASQMGQSGMPGEKDTIEQTSLKVRIDGNAQVHSLRLNFFSLPSLSGLTKMSNHIQTNHITGSGARM